MRANSPPILSRRTQDAHAANRRAEGDYGCLPSRTLGVAQGYCESPLQGWEKEGKARPTGTLGFAQGSCESPFQGWEKRASTHFRLVGTFAVLGVVLMATAPVLCRARRIRSSPRTSRRSLRS